MPSWYKKIEAITFPAEFCTRNFGGRVGVSRYASTQLIVAVSQYHSDITMFCPWSPIATGNHLVCANRKISKSCSYDWHRWRLRFWSAFRYFGTHFAESFRMSKFSRTMNPTLPREMPSCSGRRSSKISLWIWWLSPGWSLIRVVQDEAHHRWKNHHV
jgi:hypothetical protein